MPDDRLQSEEAEKKLPKPEVYIVKNGEAVFKPGMKTWFVETRKKKNNNGSGKQYRGIIIYVLVIAAVFAAIYFMTNVRPMNDDYTFSEFQKDLNGTNSLVLTIQWLLTL